MKEFDRNNFFALLALSLIWLYFVWDGGHWVANLSLTATAFSLYIFVTKIYEERSGFFSVLIFLSTLGVGLGANYAGRGAIFTLLLTVLFMLYLWEKYWCFYIFLVPGIYLFGLWPAVFVLGVIFFHCLILDRLARLGRMHLIRGILLVAAFTLPVFLYFHPVLDYSLWQKIFSREFLSAGVEYPAGFEGILALLVLITLFLPWLFVFVRGMFQSFSDCRNEEWERHVLLHLWGLLLLVAVLLLGRDFYPFLLGIFPPLAILLGWCTRRLESNFFPHRLSYGPVWDCLLGFFLLIVLWHFFGLCQKSLSFQSNLVGILLGILAGVACYTYAKFKDVEYFIYVQVLAGLVQIFFFYIYFYPVLNGG